jgi:CRP-like cAMP-binding protein
MFAPRKNFHILRPPAALPERRHRGEGTADLFPPREPNRPACVEGTETGPVMPDTLICKLGQFAKLSRTDMQILRTVTSGRLRHIGAREDVVREGDQPHVVNVFLSGWACRYKMLEDGRRQLIAFFVPGDFCDLNIFLLQEMDHSIGTITPVTVAEMSREVVADILARRPRLNAALWWDTLVKASIQREWTLNLGQRPALERIARLLCELFVRLQAVGLADGGICDLPITQVDLADATGLSPVHVNRTLQELRASNLIVWKGRSLHIPDFGALATAALFNPAYLHLGRIGRHLDAND